MRIGNTIYMDYNSTTPVDSRVLEKMLPFFEGAFANPHSTDHALGWAAMSAVQDSAAQVARLLDVDPDEIIFTSGATEANNLALLGLEHSANTQVRHGVLMGATDHKSTLSVGRVLVQHGLTMDLVRINADGQIDLEDLQQKLHPGVLVLSMGLVNSEIGSIQNLSEIAALAHRQGVLVHCDAAQAPCAMNMASVARWADMISLSAHKIYGPKGIGALYVRRDIQSLIQPLIHGGGQQHNLRSGTLPTALCVGFGAAAELLTDDCAVHERTRVAELRDVFVNELRKLPWRVTFNGGHIARHPGNANVCFAGFVAQDILGAIQPRLAASTGSACVSGTPEPSHVLRAIGITGDEAAASIRFCVGRFTTHDQVLDAAAMLAETLAQLERGHSLTAAE